MKQAKLSSLWLWTRHHWFTLSIIAVFVRLLLFVIVAYILHWTATGIPSKNAWDWFTLLVVPLILAVGGFLLSRTTSRTEQAITEQRYQNDQKLALDKQREDALQAYFDRMSELLLHEQLRTSSVEKEVRTIVRTRTVVCRIKNTVCQALSADGLRLIIWRDIIFFLCVFQSLVFLALFFGPMPLYVAEVPCYLTENEAASRLR